MNNEYESSKRIMKSLEEMSDELPVNLSANGIGVPTSDEEAATEQDLMQETITTLPVRFGPNRKQRRRKKAKNKKGGRGFTKSAKTKRRKR